MDDQDSWKSIFRSFLKKDKEAASEEKSSQNEFNANEQQIIENLSSLRLQNAEDAMIPSTDITSLEVTSPMDMVVDHFIESGHKKIPVYRETLDDAVGMVTIHDILENLSSVNPRELSQLVRPILFISPYMNLLELLMEMRTKKIHLALVVDEFGGVDGLISLDDILEKIVGHFKEDTASNGQALQRHRGGSIELHARLPIEELENITGLFLSEDEKEDFDTLGGLILALAGRVPAKGEIISHPSGIEFEIIGVDVRRLYWVRLLSKKKSS